MSIPSEKDLSDLRRSAEAAILAAVQITAEHAGGCDSEDHVGCSGYMTDDLLAVVEAWTLVSGKRPTPTTALRG